MTEDMCFKQGLYENKFAIIILYLMIIIAVACYIARRDAPGAAQIVFRVNV